MIHHPIHPEGRLGDDAYVELVTSLCGTRLPAAIMSGLFLLVGTLATMRSHDCALLILLVLGTAANALRLTILFRERRVVDAGPLQPDHARRFENRFALSFLAFAAVLGCFAARVLWLPFEDLRMPVTVLIVGYAAGVAATVGLRPRIAVPSLLLAVVPAAAALATWSSPETWISAVCMVALLFGGLRSLGKRYELQASSSVSKHVFAELAKSDQLTGLHNRRALIETFSHMARTATSDDRCIVHYLDLDGFKPVNDRLGHAAGDDLLRKVAMRLVRDAAANDIVARIGGDEFVIVQHRRGTEADDAVCEGQRLERLLDEPFVIAGADVRISGSVGSSLPHPCGVGLAQLMETADDDLRSRKAVKAMHGHGRNGLTAETGSYVLPYSDPIESLCVFEPRCIF